MSRARDRSIILGAVAAAGQRGLAFASMVVVFPIVLKTLGPLEFGIWGAATSLAWLATMADFGIGNALMTLIAQARASGRPEVARQYLAAGLLVASGLAVVVAMVGITVVAFVAPPNQMGPYSVAVLGLALNVPFCLGNYIWLALHKPWVRGAWEAVQSLLLIVTLVGASLVSRDTTVFTAAVYGSMLVAGIGSLTTLLIFNPDIRPLALLHYVRNGWLVAITGIQYFALAAVDYLSYLLDNVLALAWLGPASSAQMTIALRVCLAAVGTIGVMSQPLWPAFTEAATLGDRRWILRSLGRGSGIVVGIALISAAFLVTAGGPLLTIWLHGNISLDERLLWVMAAWIVAVSLTRVLTLMASALGAVRFQIAVFATATSIAFILKYSLSTSYGAAGILLGTAITFPLIILPAMAWWVVRWASLSRRARDSQ